MPQPSIAERVLAEIVCSREEAQGHPQDSAQADAAARQGGGDLLTRICARARHLPDADAMLAGIRHVLVVGKLLIAALLMMSAVAGIFAAATALNAASVVSLPLLLLLLVGLNAATLTLWLAAQPLLGSLRPRLTRVWRWLALHMGSAGGAGKVHQLQAIRVLVGASRGRWLAGTVVHAAWLAYTLAGLTTLLVLLSFKSYALAWETTLLSPRQLSALARFLSCGPGLLGVAGPDQLTLTAPMAAADRQGWSVWILAAVALYGALPRLLVLLLCLLPARQGLKALARDTGRPGFARLRNRLLPDHRRVGTIDPAPDHAPDEILVTRAASALQNRPLPTGALQLVAVEWGEPVPAVDRRRWIWLGTVDASADRDAATARMRGDAADGLVILVRAVATPDRGMRRLLTELVAGREDRTWLALGDLPALRARGAAYPQRVADWALLAQQAGISGGLLEWTADGAAQALQVGEP